MGREGGKMWAGRGVKCGQGEGRGGKMWAGRG